MALVGDDRWLEWEGCVNVRDLGGLPTADGRATRWGALVRTDCCDQLTDAGWAAAWDHGIRTVVDLRHPVEVAASTSAGTRPEAITVVRSPVEDGADVAFVERWGARLATPAYYGDALDRYADRVAAAVTAIAQARPGGVAFCCVAGRDRTGMVTALVLSLLGVVTADVICDHALSYQRLPLLHGDHGPALPEGWESDHADSLARLLGDLDASAYLTAAGVTTADMTALRARAVEP